ncbi:hypothetical protein E4665_12855 [Sporolactobacillus shoreae]|uniref:PucR C-terminal helix-turn-helix domain-containing protein n=1 Tax=Sporolactobacillus shoreae TaxID=1465501 RepID=A0A4Z0GKD5_9BACL|nr:helix-turn-helix domain-containing protein [Sporolactobacillus shoreae]TGA97109.1 hypothetical protein E4665_12855 [Sporolactobacillus shoreae]
MDIKNLIRRYPGTVVDNVPFHPDEDMLYFYESPYYIGVPSLGLSDRERQLLKILLNEEIPPYFSEKSRVWYDRLIKGQPVEKTETHEKVRFIHFHTAVALTRSNLIEWRSALEAFFEETACFIYLSSQNGLIIEEEGMMEGEALRAIANTLENDFSVKTHFQLGLRYPLTPLIRDAYLEELSLFQHQLAHSGLQEVSSVEHGFFSLIRSHISKSAILSEVKAMVADDSGWVTIIRALWGNQGNISMAAKQLFMHRNTLQARMDKFFEQTGISLRRMDGLTIAYLSTLE